MNKTTFTRLIQNPGAIGDADILALEQVMQAFPYCHSAHMLLAKASHDKGSMMAPQRLRKAAIQAPSRAILKKLIESAPQTERQLAYAGVLASESTSNNHQTNHFVDRQAYQDEIEDLIDNDFPDPGQHSGKSHLSENQTREAQILPFPAPNSTHKAEQELSVSEPDASEAEPETGEISEITEETANSPGNFSPETETTKTPEPEAAIADTNKNSQEDSVTAEEFISESETVEEELPEEVIPANYLAKGQPEAEEEEIIIETEIPENDFEEPVNSSATGNNPSIEPVSEIKKEPEYREEENEQVTDDLTEENLSSEKKNTLNQAVEPEKAAAEEESAKIIAITPDTEEALLAHPDELTLEQPVAELPLGQDTEAKQITTPSLSYSDELIRSIYQKSELGYAMSSSRMGECLQRKGDQTTEVPFHFQPELLVEYNLSENEEVQPEESALAAQQDIINDFLKQASKGRNRINQGAKAEEQQDLSSKSTKLNKSLISENLAQIFAMQGKNKKAIKIYQQLQLKIPEKKDYFAAQIVKLQNIS